MRPAGSGGVPASAALPLLDNARWHCLRRGALHLPARRAERDLCYDSDRLLGGNMRWSIAVFFAVALAVAPACRPTDPPRSAANASAAAPAGQGHGGHPGGAPAARTTLLGNLGSYHRTIKTANADAQKFFDEGLTLLYGFNHDEAFRSFERAAALDPQSPMPHWGMSLALGTNYNDTALPDRLQQAHLHLTHAQERAANGSEVERGFVDALSKR